MLELAPDPWPRLAHGPVAGRVVWNDEPPLPVAAKLRGVHSRKFPKRSLELAFEPQPLPDEPPAGHTVRRIHLNADYIDPTLVRSSLTFHLHEQVGVPAPRCRHTALTVGAEFAGVYLALESVDHDFYRRRGWAPGAIFYAVDRNANFGLLSPFSRRLKEPLESGYQPVEQADRALLRAMVMEINLASADDFPAVVERWFDVEAYLRWLMVTVLVGNRDAFVHNYALCHDPDKGRFRIVPWDCDATWGLDINGRPARVDRVPVQGWNKLTHRLLALPPYRRQYRDTFQQALAGPLSLAAILAHVDATCTAIAPWVEREPPRREPCNFRAGTAVLKWWAEQRWHWVRRELDAL